MLLNGAAASEDHPERLAERAGFLREFAASLRAGLTMQEALVAWAGGDNSGEMIRKARTACRLYLSPAVTLHHLRPLLGRDTEIVLLAASVHSRLGGDLATLVDAIAEQIELRSDALRAARAHTAGALASARTIALLPVGSAAVVRLLGGGPAGLDLLPAAAGVVLGVTGFRWLNRLLPRPRPQHPREMLPALLAGAVAAGIPLRSALDLTAAMLSDPDLDRARRAVRLGVSWTEALSRSASEPLADLGRALHRRAALGVPLADCLHRHLGERRLAARRRYEEALRRAPVRMILPLTLCVLPAFVLITFGPLLRATLLHA